MSAPKAARERYAEYMQTEHWQGLRSDALRNAEYQCECCTSNRELTVHHIHYRDLTDCTAQDVMALCSRCHSFAHQAFTVARKRPMDFSRHETVLLIQRFVTSGKPVVKKSPPRNLSAFNHRTKNAVRKCREANYTPASVRLLIAELQTELNTLRSDQL